MAFLDTLKSWWDSVKKLWNDLTGWTPETTAATPTTTTTTTPNTPTTDTVWQVIWNVWTVLPNIQTAETLNQLANWVPNEQVETSDENVSVASKFYDYDANEEKKVRDALKEREEPEQESIFDWITRNTNDLMKTISQVKSGLNVWDEYAKKRKVINVWYDEDSKDVYYMDLWWDYINDNWNTITSQEAFENAYNNYIKEIQAAWWSNATNEDVYNAYMKFYDNTKWLFKLKSQDFYSDWLEIKRRKDSFTDEQLSTLAKNNIKEWQYPTLEQFGAYVDSLYDNQEILSWIKEKYKTTDDDWFDVDNSQQSNFSSVFMNKAMDWVMTQATDSLAPEEIQTFIAQAYTIVQDRIEEAWKYAEPTYNAAAVIREKVRQGREITPDEKVVLDDANKLDNMLNSLANSTNFWIKDHLDSNYIKDWKIYEARDIFSDWRTLWQVISQPVLEAAWLELDEDTSWLDAFQEINEDARYHYNKNVWSDIWNIWETASHYIGKASPVLSELWQQWLYSTLKAVNYATDIYNRDIQSIADRANWKKEASKWWEYINQDWSMWMLINTEETWFWSLFWQDWSRNIRKYIANMAEYSPELIWNVVPDIILVASSWWTWAPARLATRIPAISNYLKRGADVIRATNTFRKLSEANIVRKSIWWLRWLEEAAIRLSRLEWVPNSLRYAWNRTAKLVKDWIIDQVIDLQYTPYDSENYSDVSFWLSVWWTALFELLPNILFSSWAYRMLRNKINGDYLTKGTVLDVMDFLKRDENKNILDEFTKRYWRYWTLWFSNYEMIANNMDDLSKVIRDNWNMLPDTAKPIANKWTKELAYRLMNQVYDINSNSILWRNMRAIISKEWTSVADMYKYIMWISWDIKIWPWTSIIRLKNPDWAAKTILWVEWWAVWWYNQQLDMVVDWWLASKLKDWFDLKDIEAIKTLPEYSNVNESMFTLWDWWKYFINEDWVKALKISTIDLPLEYQARELAKQEAWNVTETFRKIMKELRTERRNITDPTIDAVANSGTYQDVREKVADIVC